MQATVRRVILAGAALAVCGGVLTALVCGGSEAERPAPHLLLHCGAGIRPAAEALIRAFNAQSGCTVAANYGGSGHLLAQVSAFPTGDLFMPGDELYVDLAIAKKLADPATRRTVAFFIPVIFVARGNPKGIGSLENLKAPGLRIGLGDERACAVGQTTVELLARNGIPPSAIEPNVVFKRGTVNELAAAVQIGSVDAAIVWDATARQAARHGEIVPIPPDRNVISTVPIAVLNCSRLKEEARRFVEFAASEEGRRLVGAAGYTVVPPPGAAGGAVEEGER